jgi:hypothetical protein
MSPARFRWGLFLVLIGTLLLLRNNDVLNDNFWADLLIYLPVILIAVGIEKIFAKSRAKVISYLTSAFLFIGALYIAFSGSLGGVENSFFSKTAFEQEYDPSVRTLYAILELDETDLTIRDSGDEMIYARFNRFTRKPKIEYEVTGGEAKVTLESRSQPRSFLGGAVRIDTGDPQDWYLRFARNIPLELECLGSGSDLHLNFATTPLRRLKLDADDARIYLKLGDCEPLVKIDIVGEDANLRLRIPQNIGLKVRGEDYRSYLDRVGLIKSNEGFVTSGFDTVKNKIEVNLDDRLGSFSIDFF